MRIADLPPSFIRTVTTTFPNGAAWLDQLPALQDEMAARWHVSVGEPFALSFNYVARATAADGTPLVLKLGYRSADLLNEMTAMQIFAGRGAARLVEFDRERGAMLLEQVRPGTRLLELGDDEEETRLAAHCFAALRQPAPTEHGLPTTHSWQQAIAQLRPFYGGGTGPFPTRLVDASERLFAELHADAPAPFVLHGDLHHENVLHDAQRGWVAIDPHGVVGDPLAEVGAFLHNPYDRIVAAMHAGTLRELLARRVAILAEILGGDPQRIAAWGIGYALLSAWWCVDEDKPPAPLDPFAAASVACGEALLDVVTL